MDENTLNYVGADTHEPLAQQKALARPLRFWGMMLVALALTLAVLVTVVYLLEWTWGWVLTPDGQWEWVVVGWSIDWRQVPKVLPAVLGPVAYAWAYFHLAGRLERRAEDRMGLVATLILTTMHAMGAALMAILMFVLGTASIALGAMSLRRSLILLTCTIVLAMVPGMIYTSVRVMDVLRMRVVRRAKVKLEEAGEGVQAEA